MIRIHVLNSCNQQSHTAQRPRENSLSALMRLMRSLFCSITHVNNRWTYCPFFPHNVSTTTISNTFRCPYAARGWIRRFAAVSLSYATKKTKNFRLNLHITTYMKDRGRGGLTHQSHRGHKGIIVM